MPADHGIIFQFAALAETGLPTYHDMFAKHARTGQARLRGNHGVRANLAVVADVDQIVQLHAFSDARIIERAAVDRGVCADFDVVANFHNSGLRKFPVFSVTRSIPKTVRANDRAGMNLHAMADADTGVKRNARMNPAIFADPASRSDHGVRADLSARTNMGVFADHRVRTDADTR